MPARLCIHIPDDAAIVRLLDDGARAVLGRDSNCDVVVVHNSVSRAHAAIHHDAIGWHLRDLESKNGVRVDGERVTQRSLGAHSWFAIGDVYCEFEVVAEAQRDILAQNAERRRFSSRVWVERLAAANSGEELLAQVLTAVVELAECQRGFLLVGDGRGEMSVRARYNLHHDVLEGAGFEGSRSALNRALRERRMVMLTSADDRAWLRQQASVVRLGLRSLVCVPLEHDGTLVGAVYADSDVMGRVFTTIDAQLLRAFSQQAALTLAVAQVDGRLNQLLDVLDLGQPEAGPGAS
jgi:hypothetical protein